MTNLIPYRSGMNPYHHSMESDLFGDFFRPFLGEMWKNESFRVDVKDTGSEYLLEAELPGVKKEDVQIDVNDGMLTISAAMNNATREERNGYILSERRSGSFSRSFSLENIQEDGIRAEYADGVLKLTMPKQTETTARSRRIEIQ